LISITRHRAFDLLRSRTASEHELRSVDADDITEPVDPRPHLDEAVDAHRVRGAMSALSADQRQSLALAYFHGLPLSEVAEQLGVPLNSVKSRVHRAMGRLRAILEQRPA
jgi:RNA polymerase sigma-70 factor (ECF subfamily)